MRSVIPQKRFQNVQQKTDVYIKTLCDYWLIFLLEIDLFHTLNIHK
jgi:hypothetical protein